LVAAASVKTSGLGISRSASALVVIVSAMMRSLR
jgi:hypothetical protein